MYRTLDKNEEDYKRMEAVAKILTAYSTHGADYIVQGVYLDLGQDWMWTTICRKGYRDCQVLCPRDWEAITMAETPADLLKVVEVIRTDKYFND